MDLKGETSLLQRQRVELLPGEQTEEIILNYVTKIKKLFN